LPEFEINVCVCQYYTIYCQKCLVTTSHGNLYKSIEVESIMFWSHLHFI